MITYKDCSQVSISDIFQAFSIGFSDYVVPLTISQDEFEQRFFGPEGNSREVSFLAYDQDRPVGLILGGIRNWDGMLTMRCGTLCIAPDYRGTGVAQALYRYHLEAAKAQGCRQLFLEVIKGNDRAIRFYKTLGYEPVYDLKYFGAEVKTLQRQVTSDWPVTSTTYEAIVNLRRSLPDLHINWQSDVESYAEQEGHQFLSVQAGETMVGALAMSPAGKINFLWVSPQHRHQGIATSLILSGAENLKLDKVNLCFPSNALVEGFVRHSLFVKAEVEQHEMYHVTTLTT